MCYNSKLTTNTMKIDFLSSRVDLSLSLMTWLEYSEAIAYFKTAGNPFGALFVRVVLQSALILKRDLKESVLIHTKSNLKNPVETKLNPFSELFIT